ncbi:MAG: hypothetical protein AAF962_20575 [Actinomycetota bacterium]
MAYSDRQITGRLHGVTGKAELAGVEVWFAYTTVHGVHHNTTTHSDGDGAFAFDVPIEALDRAAIGAHLDGVGTVDLEPAGVRLEPGDLVLMVDDIVPSFIRYAG